MSGFLLGGYGPDHGGSARGISYARVAEDGRLEVVALLAEAESPSWLSSADGVVYAALESRAELASFALGDGPTLTPLGRVDTGAVPCHIAVDARAAIVACYGDGVVTVHPLGADGAAGPAAQRIAGSGSGPRPAQQGPHAHHVLALSHDRVATADLGADRIHLHHRTDGALERYASVRMPAGTGPRDLAALPDGRIAVLGEWSCEVLFLEPAGETFAVAGSVALPGDDGDSQAAGLALAAGRYLISGLRGSDRLAVVEVTGDGPLAVGSTPCGGRTPRHLVVVGETVHVANQRSDSIASFRLLPDGTLAALGEPTPAPSPACLLPLP